MFVGRLVYTLLFVIKHHGIAEILAAELGRHYSP
jgi:hypothetical protein